MTKTISLVALAVALTGSSAFAQDTLADMETIRKNPAGSNPLLYGKESANRYWKTMDECATARVIALEQAGTK